MKIRSIFIAAALATAPVMIAPTAFAEAPIYTGTFSNSAIQGYDAVSYFTPGAPVKGSSKYQVEYDGADFYFVSQENLDKFNADPAAYLPQYGGYCAWAMAEGKHAKGDARYWEIVDGKLYLNYNKSIQSKWAADKPGFIEKGDTQWSAING